MIFETIIIGLLLVIILLMFKTVRWLIGGTLVAGLIYVIVYHPELYH